MRHGEACVKDSRQGERHFSKHFQIKLLSLQLGALRQVTVWLLVSMGGIFQAGKSLKPLQKIDGLLSKLHSFPSKERTI